MKKASHKVPLIKKVLTFFVPLGFLFFRAGELVPLVATYAKECICAVAFVLGPLRRYRRLLRARQTSCRRGARRAGGCRLCRSICARPCRAAASGPMRARGKC